MFNYRNWSSNKFWCTMAVVFFLGMLIPIRTQTKETIREVPKEVVREVIKEVPAQCDYSDWKKLKAIDDQGFTYCTVALELASQGFTSLDKMDKEETDSILSQMQTNTQRILEAANARQSLLDKLGY